MSALEPCVGQELGSAGIAVPPRCFLHIPKSGGVSIHTALEAALAPGSIAPKRFDRSVFCDFDDFELLNPQTRARIAISREEVLSLRGSAAVSGHFSLKTLLQVAPASSIATVLREPRARLLSLYLYWRTPGVGDSWAPYRAHEHSSRRLSEFLSEPRLAPAIDNAMCRMLLEADPRLPRAGFADRADIESIAAAAIEQLEALGFVGVLELGESVWRGVADLFGVKLEPMRLNVTGEFVGPNPAVGSNERLIDGAAFDLLEQRGAADLMVYDHILARSGFDRSERRRVAERAYAQQLVKLGDLLGPAAGAAAEQAMALSGERERHEREREEMQDMSERLLTHEAEIRDLSEGVRRRDEEIAKLRSWLFAVHASVSWQLTAPLRVAKRVTHQLSLRRNR